MWPRKSASCFCSSARQLHQLLKWCPVEPRQRLHLERRRRSGIYRRAHEEWWSQINRAVFHVQSQNIGTTCYWLLGIFLQSSFWFVSRGFYKTVFCDGLPVGSITMEDLIAVLPFSGTYDLVELKGSTLRKAFEHSVERYGQGTGEFLQVSGIRTFTSTLVIWFIQKYQCFFWHTILIDVQWNHVIFWLLLWCSFEVHNCDFVGTKTYVIALQRFHFIISGGPIWGSIGYSMSL